MLVFANPKVRRTARSDLSRNRGSILGVSQGDQCHVVSAGKSRGYEKEAKSPRSKKTAKRTKLDESTCFEALLENGHGFSQSSGNRREARFFHFIKMMFRVGWYRGAEKTKTKLQVSLGGGKKRKCERGNVSQFLKRRHVGEKQVRPHRYKTKTRENVAGFCRGANGSSERGASGKTDRIKWHNASGTLKGVRYHTAVRGT